MPIPQDPAVQVGFDTGDDAGVYRLDDETALIQTVDFFTPIVDDPEDYGAIACANSVSDVYAMGGYPLTGLNIVCFPTDKLEQEVLTRILSGAAATAAEGNFSIIGGHCVKDSEPKYGLAVTGKVHPDRVITKDRAEPGDRLLLTKPIGTGIITTAIKAEEAGTESRSAAIDAMKDLNDDAARAARGADVRCGTDVTGFGLLGHLQQITESSGVTARINTDRVPLLPDVRNLAEAGIVPGGSRTNLEQVKEHLVYDEESVSEEDLFILADAQTSGGLLMSVSPEEVEGVKDTLTPGPSYFPEGGQVIGEITDGKPGTIHIN